MTMSEDIEALRPFDLAMDLDGTLALSHQAALDEAEIDRELLKSGKFTPQEWQAFNRAQNGMWSLDGEGIDPVPGAVELMRDAREADFIEKVTVLTHRTGQLRAVTSWLDEHEILYDEFVSVPSNGPKGVHAHDVYVDDREVEQLPEGAIQLVPNRWYNEDTPGHRVKNYEEIREVLGL